MGRWGDGIYDSDASLDFFATILNRLIRDMSFWFAPEQVKTSPWWLREGLTLIEILLMFDMHEIGTTVNLSHQETAIKRWQDTFFQVWDAEWEGEKEADSPYRTSAYRVEHRRVATEWFSRMYDVATYWSGDDKSPKLKSFSPRERLPYFSITRLKTRFDKQYSIAGSALSELRDMLIQKIVFVLSEENRGKDDGVDFPEVEEIWVAVDIIGVLCSQYEIHPGLTAKTIQRCHEKMTAIWIENFSEDAKTPVDVKTLAEESDLYNNVLTIFERLKALDQQYPGWDAI